MRTVIFGKVVENTYEVDHNWKRIKDESGETKTVYIGKPVVTKTVATKNWVELCSYDGEPRYNSNSGFFICNRINISENETVVIEEEIFRADLNEMHLHTNKVLETIDINEDEIFGIYEDQIRAFNRMMIESNDKLMAYCNLHCLGYENTDCLELFKLVFPNDDYVIVDGVMKVKERKNIDRYSLMPYLENCATISYHNNQA